MAKYLISATYTSNGIKGLREDTATKRQNAVSNACNALGGKLDNMFWSFGNYDTVCIAEFPNNNAAAAFGLAVNQSGSVRVTTTPLLTAQETDQALTQNVDYRAPGQS